MATTLFEGHVCACCILRLANDDESGCRDYHGHTEADHPMTGQLVTDLMPGTQIPLSAWTVPAGPEETICGGRCDMCGVEFPGYWDGFPVAVIR